MFYSLQYIPLVADLVNCGSGQAWCRVRVERRFKLNNVHKLDLEKSESVSRLLCLTLCNPTDFFKKLYYFILFLLLLLFFIVVDFVIH